MPKYYRLAQSARASLSWPMAVPRVQLAPHGRRCGCPTLLGGLKSISKPTTGWRSCCHQHCLRLIPYMNLQLAQCNAGTSAEHIASLCTFSHASLGACRPASYDLHAACQLAALTRAQSFLACISHEETIPLCHCCMHSLWAAFAESVAW